jgi:enoyl-CoA hydratase
MSEPDVRLERHRDAIALIVLNRPQRMNALTSELLEELTTSVSEVERDGSYRVIVLTGAGRAFCSGADLKVALERRDAGAVRRFAVQQQFAGAAALLRRVRIPVIAAVNGPCVGAGLGLALACDVCIAAASATFDVGAVRRGMSAGESSISYALPRAIGWARAYEIMLTGRRVSAEEAERIGLVARMVADDVLRDEAFACAEAICANSPFAIESTKRVMRRNLDASFEAAIDLENASQIVAGHSLDAGEAFRAFVEKRSPQFRGA